MVLDPNQQVHHSMSEEQHLALRRLSAEEAAHLSPGDHHYRAYVGPPVRYDLMSATQFALLYLLGLREHHKLLDFGCGSLRAGKVLMPFLAPDRYFGIEPNSWLVEDGIAHEIGADMVRLKRPRFLATSDWRSDGFGETFDFILAQSIATHTGVQALRAMLKGFSDALRHNGLVVFSYWPADTTDAEAYETEWLYPGCFKYAETDVAAFAEEAGLVYRRVPWPHAGNIWWALLAHEEAALPPAPWTAQLSVAPFPRPTE